MKCVDISAKSLDETKRRLGELAGRVTFIAADVGDVPIEDASADFVTMNAALHHMPDPPRVMEEVNRILKPGGYFCLGHEPNKRFFRSRILVGLEKLIWHTFWYLSPSQNLRRMQQRLGLSFRDYERREHLDEINQVLLEEGIIAQALARDEMRKLVDVHTHSEGGGETAAGFDVTALVEESFPRYVVRKIVFSDYGGEMLRKSMIVRSAFDGMMNCVAPGQGRLFSLILQKPAM